MINLVASEKGQAVIGYILLVLVIAIVVIGCIALLTGNTTVLDAYNNTGEFFKGLEG